MSSPEDFNPQGFGFMPDENGDINFLTIQTEFEIKDFHAYGEWFKALVQVAYDNPGYMPIVTFPEFNRDNPPPFIPPPELEDDEDDET